MPAFLLLAQYRQLYCFDDGVCPPYPANITDSDLEHRFKAVPFLVAIYTATDGEIEVRLERGEHEAATDEAVWRHIVEGPLDLPSGSLVTTPISFLPNAPRLHVAPGSYRLRAASRGFDAGEREQYLLFLWPI